MEFYLSAITSVPALGPTQPLSSGYWGLLSQV